MHKKMNFVGEISHYFALRRPLSFLLLIGVVLFGLLAFFLLPKQYNPEIVRPAFSVTLNYAGATSDEAINRVVYELVEKIGSVPGVDEILTNVTDGAVITTTVIFDVGYDKTKAKIDLLSYINQHSYLAKGEIGLPSIFEINPETIPVMQIVFRSNTLTIESLRQEVMILSHQVSAVTDVSEVSVVGGYTPALIVEINQTQMLEERISLEDIKNALSSSQLRVVSLGIVGDTYTLETTFDGQAKGVEAMGNLEIISDVALHDIANVYIGTAGTRSYVLEQNTAGIESEIVMLSVAKVEGSSAPVVTSKVSEVIDAHISKLPEGTLMAKIVSDDGVTASSEIKGLTLNLGQSILIVVAVLLLFLSFRSAFVVLVAIPTTLLIVFGMGYIFDQTINRITLFALILSLGLLVDSAIVVVENIYSHLKEAAKEPTGMSRERVIAGAVDEIGVGLLLSTVTSVVVFVPMFYITGMMGPYMSPIAFFVPLALVVSLLVSVIFVPFVASVVINAHEKPTWLARQVTAVMDNLLWRYRQFMTKVFASRRLQKKLLLGVLTLFIVTLLLPLFGLVHFQMLPHANRDQFYVYIDAPLNTSVEATRSISHNVSTVLSANLQVESVQQFVGAPPIIDFNNMFKGAQNRKLGSEATLRVNLVQTGERKQSSTEIVYALRAKIIEAYPDYESIVRLMEEPPGPPVQATLVSKVVSEDAAVREQVSHDLLSLYLKIPGVVDRYSSADEPVGRIVYTFNDTVAEALGVKRETVFEALSLFAGAMEVTEYQSSKNIEYTPILVTVPATERVNSEQILNHSVFSTAGEGVPLRSVLQVSHELHPSNISLEDVSQMTYVTGELEHRSIIYVVIDLMRQIIGGGIPGYTVTNWNLFGMELISDSGIAVQVNFGGEWEMTLENFRDLGLAMLVALVLVYGVLVAQYNTFSTPGYILVTVPLGLIGILWGFLIMDKVFGVYLTATALIGFIALIGIAVNNAIILLEYVNQMKEKGMLLSEALLEAGVARLRPIVLTSLTTVLGSLTIASDPVWSGLAWSIVFGLSLSAMLTLVVYPTLLVFLTREK
jgi:multidrug efflux pump subunit AcrB